MRTANDDIAARQELAALIGGVPEGPAHGRRAADAVLAWIDRERRIRSGVVSDRAGDDEPRTELPYVLTSRRYSRMLAAAVREIASKHRPHGTPYERQSNDGLARDVLAVALDELNVTVGNHGPDRRGGVSSGQDEPTCSCWHPDAGVPEPSQPDPACRVHGMDADASCGPLREAGDEVAAALEYAVERMGPDVCRASVTAAVHRASAAAEGWRAARSGQRVAVGLSGKVSGLTREPTAGELGLCGPAEQDERTELHGLIQDVLQTVAEAATELRQASPEDLGVDELDRARRKLIRARAIAAQGVRPDGTEPHRTTGTCPACGAAGESHPDDPNRLRCTDWGCGSSWPTATVRPARSEPGMTVDGDVLRDVVLDALPTVVSETFAREFADDILRLCGEAGMTVLRGGESS